MPIQSPQRNDYLNCSICDLQFGPYQRAPISLPCGHTFCYHCLYLQKTEKCPIDQIAVTLPPDKAVVNTALLQLVGIPAPPRVIRPSNMSELTEKEAQSYDFIIRCLERIALYLQPEQLIMGNVTIQRLSRPMQRRIIALLNSCLMSEDALDRICIPIRNLAERLLNELSTLYQLQGQLSTNLWTAVRNRGCQFLGPGVQEEVLKLILLALEDGTALSRKVLVLFVVQRLQDCFPQTSKTSIGHVVQLLYRASCFKVLKCSGSSSLMQLKEEFRTYMTLRREHDSQIVEMAQDSGLRIAPEQWSALLYGDASHKSQMQSVIDKLQALRNLNSYVRELKMALYRHGNESAKDNIMNNLPTIAELDNIYEGTETMTWGRLALVMNCLYNMVTILCEPPPPPMLQNMPFDEDDMPHYFGDYLDPEYENFGDHPLEYIEAYDQEYGEYQDSSDQYDQNEDGQGDGNDDLDNGHEYFDDQADNEQDDAPDRLYIPHDDELDELDYPFDMLFLENDEEPRDDERNDEDYEYYAADDNELLDMFVQEQEQDDAEEQINQEEPVIPNLDFLEPQVVQQPYQEQMIDQQHIMVPYRMIDIPVPAPFNGGFAPAWLPPNGYNYPIIRQGYMPPMHEFIGPVMPMANGQLGYPDMDIPAPRHLMEMMYNNNLVPALQPFVGPYYHLLDNEYHAMYQPVNDVPAPPAPREVFENEQAFNFGGMAAALPEVPQFRAPGQIAHVPVLAPPPLPMIPVAPVFPAPILAPGPIQVPRPVLIQPQTPVHHPGQGHVGAPGPEAAPGQVPYAAAALEPAAQGGQAPAPVAAEEADVEDNHLYEEEIAQSILYLERLLDVEYDV